MLGAENGARTRDLNLGKVALYQLSYFRVSGMQRYDIFLAFASFSALFCIPFLFFPSVWPLGRRISHHYHSPHGHHARPPAHRSALVARPLSLSRRNHLAPRASHRPATPQRPLALSLSHLPIPYDGPAVLDINFDYAVAGDLAFEDGA